MVQGGQLYVIGGWGGGVYVDEIVRYDTSTDTWSVVGILSEGRFWSGVAVDNDGGIFVVGGRSAGSDSAVVERFDTRSLQISVLGGGTSSLLSLPLAPAAPVPAGWTEAANALPRSEPFACMLTGV